MGEILREKQAYFISPDGERIPKKDEDMEKNLQKNTGIHHKDIANDIIRNNPGLLEEYEESGLESKSIFIITKGYIHVIEDIKYNTLIMSCCSISLNDITRSILWTEKEEYGADIHDIISDDSTFEPYKEQIKQMFKDGKSIDEILKTIVWPVFNESYNKKAEEQR